MTDSFEDWMSEQAISLLLVPHLLVEMEGLWEISGRFMEKVEGVAGLEMKEYLQKYHEGSS